MICIQTTDSIFTLITEDLAGRHPCSYHALVNVLDSVLSVQSPHRQDIRLGLIPGIAILQISGAEIAYLVRSPQITDEIDQHPQRNLRLSFISEVVTDNRLIALLQASLTFRSLRERFAFLKLWQAWSRLQASNLFNSMTTFRLWVSDVERLTISVSVLMCVFVHAVRGKEGRMAGTKSGRKKQLIGVRSEMICDFFWLQRVCTTKDALV